MSEELYELPDGLLIRDAGEAAQQWANLANRLQAENERLREALNTQFPGLVEISKDAERYRWLRDNNWPDELSRIICLHMNTLWDEAIDADRLNDD